MKRSDLMDLVKDLQEAGVTVILGLNLPLSVLEPGQGNEEPGGGGDGGEDPVEPDTLFVQVQGGKAVARFTRSTNAAGVPIMEIYPSDTSAASERIIFFQGEVLPVRPEKVRADGGAQYYAILDEIGKYPAALYVRAGDVVLVA